MSVSSRQPSAAANLVFALAILSAAVALFRVWTAFEAAQERRSAARASAPFLGSEEIDLNDSFAATTTDGQASPSP
jgi:hypothetical protein